MSVLESFYDIRSKKSGASKSTDTNDDPVPTFEIGELLSELKEVALSVQVYTRY